MTDTTTTTLPATATTRAAQEEVRGSLPFADLRNVEEADRGFIGTLDPCRITDAEGRVVWEMESFTFLEDEAPDTVNPSLWRNARLSARHGLFEVVDGVYQVRGFDLSNMTVVLGDTGYIVIDPLLSAETAAAGMALVREHLGDRPVTGVVYTHSHVDHFGGVKGVVSAEDAAARGIPIVAPADFLSHAVSENVFAGNAMSRRAAFMYGGQLDRDPRGLVTTGLGPAISAGSLTLIPPTHSVTRTGETLEIDGVALEFQVTHGAEAPSDMNVFLPAHRALCLADNIVHTMHNLYTLRGAQVRDAIAWSEYLDEVIDLYLDRTDALFVSHQWPAWGRDRCLELLTMQRDLYRYVHDETLRLANAGHTIDEIPELIELPRTLGEFWSNRGYYGTLKHNAKAVYQKYLGYFDGNPANLDPHDPASAAVRYVEFMGGVDALLEKARVSFDEGDYRWVAEVVGHAVFADPTSREARELQAAAFEQLGYQAESAVWRNFYLCGARELRLGTPPPGTQSVTPDIIGAMTLEMMLSYLGIRLIGPQAAQHPMVLNIEVGESRAAIEISNGCLVPQLGRRREDAAASITVQHGAFAMLALGAAMPADLPEGAISIDGDAGLLDTLLGLCDRFDPSFAIVTP